MTARPSPPRAARRIEVRGARENNLKGVDLSIPRGALVVITGPSGSGKSSLAFDTLYAEGQRRYVETLSAYARQFLEELPRPDVDSVEGLSPAVSIDQRPGGTSARSTVGTMTEVYDFMRLLWARCGEARCPDCDVAIEPLRPDQIVERLLAGHEGEKVVVLAPMVEGRKGEHRDVLERIRRSGFARARVDGADVDLAGPLPRLARTHRHSVAAVVDRPVVRRAARARLAEAIGAAAALADGAVLVEVEGRPEAFSTARGCPRCGRGLPDLHPRRFSFNSPYGACPRCDGLGVAEDFVEETVADAEAPLQHALRPFHFQTDRFAAGLLRASARALGLDPATPWGRLPAAARRTLLEGGNLGAGDSEGAFPGFLRILSDRWERGGERVRGRLAVYRAPLPCRACGGARLRPEARAVRVGGRAIAEVAGEEVGAAAAFFAGLAVPPARARIADPILREIRPRLRFLVDVGLGYLSLDRPAPTLSGGEAQRVRLAAALGAGLSGVLYVLDEPTVGLHPRDTEALLDTLRSLSARGNTVVVVEHDEATMRAADVLVDLGPGGGSEGGELLYAGPPEGIGAAARSVTADFLCGRRRIEAPPRRPPDLGALRLRGATGRNLKGVDLEAPFGMITCVAGVSGSGKSTLVLDTLVPAVRRAVAPEEGDRSPLPFRLLEGAEGVERIVEVTQAPIGRTPRSNPATYVGLFDAIRALYAGTPEAKMRGWGPGRFSFNVAGGRCERCAGDGAVKVEMHFLPDVFVRCEACDGRRYNRETLEILFKGRTIADVLEMTVEEAFAHFASVPAVAARLRLLVDVGLGYVRLGQSATTLSGGEAQRVKLAAELSRRGEGKTLHVLDEPTTGLHFAEVERLLAVLRRLADRGDAVVVVEHHPHVVAAADRVLELGPGAGADGGRIVGVR